MQPLSHFTVNFINYVVNVEISAASSQFLFYLKNFFCKFEIQT